MKLEDVLNSIEYDSSADVSEGDLTDDITKKMPGWCIETWDMDDWNTTLTQSVVDVISQEIAEGRTEIQYGEWHTNCEDFYVAVLATRKPKDC